MPLTEQDLVQVLAEGESERVEFKERFRDPRLLARNIAALANTSGGTLYVGIREPHQIVGTEIVPLRRMLEDALRRISPTPTASLEAVSVGDRDLGVIAVAKAPELVLTDEGALVRVGSVIRPMASGVIATGLGRLAEMPKRDT